MNKYTFRAETLTLLRDIDGYMAALAAQQGILTPIYHDPAPGDYGTDQCPRTSSVAADVPQEATIPPAPDARTVDWPSGPGLYWISGESDDGPCQGVASLTQTTSGARELTLIDGHDAIWEIAQDRLHAATPLTCVPTALLERLYDASSDSYGRANEAIHDIEQWTCDHGTVTE